MRIVRARVFIVIAAFIFAITRVDTRASERVIVSPALSLPPYFPPASPYSDVGAIVIAVVVPWPFGCLSVLFSLVLLFSALPRRRRLASFRSESLPLSSLFMRVTA